MIDYVTTDGMLVMSAPDEAAGLHHKGDVLCFDNGKAFIVIQRTWNYTRMGGVAHKKPNIITLHSEKGIEEVSSDADKIVDAHLQILLQEVAISAK